jgi:hypothetical protein
MPDVPGLCAGAGKPCLQLLYTDERAMQLLKKIGV